MLPSLQGPQVGTRLLHALNPMQASCIPPFPSMLLNLLSTLWPPPLFCAPQGSVAVAPPAQPSVRVEMFVFGAGRGSAPAAHLVYQQPAVSTEPATAAASAGIPLHSSTGAAGALVAPAAPLAGAGTSAAGTLVLQGAQPSAAAAEVRFLNVNSNADLPEGLDLAPNPLATSK